MMITFSRRCLTDCEVIDNSGRKLVLQKGEEYLTTEEKDGCVVVFTNNWAKVPANIFDEGRQFTGERWYERE